MIFILKGTDQFLNEKADYQSLLNRKIGEVLILENLSDFLISEYYRLT